MKGLKDRVIVVTGGSMGIGRATAIRLAEEGARVAICDIVDNDGRMLANDLKARGLNASFYHLDVGKEAEVQEVFGRISKELGLIYGLVNNAGISGVSKPSHEIEEKDWDKVFTVNVKGVFFCTKHAIPQMIAGKGGSIVNLSSIYGLVGAEDAPPYHATKGAVRLMTKTDALFYAKYGIRVNSVHPGFIDTPMVQNFADSTGNRSLVYDQLRSLHPLGRLGKSEEIASGIAFLLSDEASFMTGSELVIDGGYTAR
ncbi:MAG: SDR family NAD(P)-dependent oxidoreductase [Methanomassiliicoccales archaeon]